MCRQMRSSKSIQQSIEFDDMLDHRVECMTAARLVVRYVLSKSFKYLQIVFEVCSNFNICEHIFCLHIFQCFQF